MYLQVNQFSMPAKSFPGPSVGTPGGLIGEPLLSEVMGRYSTLVKQGVVQTAYATLTAPVIFSTAAGTGGPLIWNKPSSGVDAHLLAVGFSSSVVTTVAGGLGITGAAGQTVAPSATTAIDASGNALIGGPASRMGGLYRVGTVTNAGAQLVPFAQFHTGALTVDTTGLLWQFLDGIFICPPGSWISAAATATLTTLQVQVALIWAELPT
jgi:hypothetical protein